MPSRVTPPAFVTITVIEEFHAAFVLEGLEAADVPAEALPVAPYAQLDHFRPHRLPLVAVRVPASEAARAAAVLRQLSIESIPAAIGQSQTSVDPGERRDANSPGQRETPRFGARTSRTVIAAVLTTAALVTPLFTQVRDRVQRALEARAHSGQPRITRPSAVENVQRELEAAGLR